MKTCTACKKEKPETEEFFHPQATGKGGLTAACRGCHKKRMKVSNRKYYEANTIREKLRTLRRFDERRGTTFDLTEEWVKENIAFKPCTYCGGTDTLCGPDRIDNDKGHTMDNVIPACRTCNVVRNNLFDVEEMKLIGVVIAQIKASRL
jgi:hypothetical protein